MKRKIINNLVCIYMYIYVSVYLYIKEVESLTVSVFSHLIGFVVVFHDFCHHDTHKNKRLKYYFFSLYS